jgi:protein ImuA
MASPAVARETFLALRRKIAKIEGRLADRLDAPVDQGAATDAAPLAPPRRRSLPRLKTGIPGFDKALGGGLPLAGLTEILGPAMRDAGTIIGFALALVRLLPEAQSEPVLWIGTPDIFREAGRPYAPGMASRFGLPPERLLLAEAAKPVDTLWIAEEAANTAVFSAILLEVQGSPQALDLTATRRLHRRALLTGRPLLLLRESGATLPTAAPVRLIVTPASSTERTTLAGPLAGSIGPPAFHVTVSKSPAAIPATAFTLEWNHDAFQQRQNPGTANPGALVSASAGGAHHAPALRPVVAFPNARRDAAAGVQPARKQHPARGGARRAG